jgi:large subunit ribosomal protein L13
MDPYYILSHRILQSPKCAVAQVINAAKVKFTGDKMEEKVYYWHTGYPGGIKQRTPTEQFVRKPEEVR